MPRLTASSIRRAYRFHPSLVPLLQQCRDWTSAQNEFRWIREHVEKLYHGEGRIARSILPPYAETKASAHLQRLCQARGRGQPLQYILGTEFFGDLELAVKPGVLIPRRETAIAAEHLASRLDMSKSQGKLRILDLCSGCGCISHLLFHRLQAMQGFHVEILGVDISPTAVNLARHNGTRLWGSTDAAVKPPRFELADVLANSKREAAEDMKVSSLLALLQEQKETSWDVVVANPPYISQRGFQRDTERSVRKYEPGLALVPQDATVSIGYPVEDSFYPHVFDVAERVNAKVMLVEVGDLDQAKRVAEYLESRSIWPDVQIWRDDPCASRGRCEEGNVSIIGDGDGRSVVCWRDDAMKA